MGNYAKINVLLGVLAIALSVLTCKTLAQKSEPSPAPIPSQTPQSSFSNEILGVKALRVSESAEETPGVRQIEQTPPYVHVPVDGIQPPSASRRAYLSTGWWHLNMAFQPTDSTIHKHYIHKWLRFYEDQRFEVLVKNQVVDQGRWNWDEGAAEIYLACKDPYVNNVWTVKDNGYVMIWKGNNAINATGIQIRVVGSRTPPPSN
ncbi:MAG: hypothetical protein ACK4NS_00605 [Saprospiraceae bacterium]